MHAYIQTLCMCMQVQAFCICVFSLNSVILKFGLWILELLKMPVDTVFSLIGKAKDAIFWIIDRIDQLKLSDSVVTRIKEILEYLELTIKKIEPHIKKDGDTEELKNFLTHLQKASESCASIEKKNTLIKLATAPGILVKLHTVEAEVKTANAKLLLFITSNNLTMFCDATDFQNKKLTKISALQENNRVGLNIVTDKSVRRPSAPFRLTISENKNKFILSWEPCRETVKDYEICYNEHENLILSVGKVTTVEIGSPRVLPGNLYTMKVRAINKGGKGEWSNSVVGQFTKPFPQKPEILSLFLRSTIAVVTVKIPDAICSTESPVECVEVSWVNTTNTEWSNHKFRVKPTEKYTYDFAVDGLQSDSKYNFRVRTKNAEGWSEPSELITDNTLTLPPKPAKPDPPFIEAHTATEVALAVKVPKNTCGIKSPVVEWKVSGYNTDKEKIDRYWTRDQTRFMEKSGALTLANLKPNQKYTLQLFVKNETGWSAPSEEFTIWIAMPSTPKNVRVSTKRTHSLIKIRWKKPDSSLITHYEIMKKTRKGNYEGKPKTIPATKFSATFTKLKQNTHYCFAVRTCNGSYVSKWIVIEANTRIHKAIKAALSPAVWALGTAGSPIITPIASGAAAGMVGNKASGKKVAVAAGTAGTVGGAAVGLIGAPLIGAGLAHVFVHGIDGLSDQSDDEDAVIIED